MLIASIVQWWNRSRPSYLSLLIRSSALVSAAFLAVHASSADVVRPAQCSCPETCLDECPPPEGENEDCTITGAADPCMHGGNGCNGDNYFNGCCFLWGTPVLLDVDKGDFRLTSLAGGVPFRIGAN